MNKPDFKPIAWVGTSLQDLRELPEVAQSKIGRALQQVQYGSKPTSARVLSGFHGANVLEMRVDYDSDTYRAVYTVRFAEQVYGLHVFQKKSRHGVQTSKQDIDIVQARLKLAEEAHREFLTNQERR